MPVRVLFLHGWGGNAAAMGARVARGLGRKLPPALFELVFLDGPVDLPPLLLEAEEAAAAAAAPPGRHLAWFTYNSTPEDAARTREDTLSPDAREYLRWPEARAAIARAWTARGPFDAILGFSQGAIAAHQLLRELAHLRALAGGAEAAARAAGFGAEELALLRRPPRCAVLIGGRTSCHVWPPAAGAALAIPTLHVMSAADSRIPLALQQQLRDACGAGAEELLHEKGHVLPAAAAHAAAVAAFLLKHAAPAEAAAGAAAATEG